MREVSFAPPLTSHILPLTFGRMDPILAQLAPHLAGQYEIERELGRGGMGVVYLARELQLERHVALKVLPPHLNSDPTIRERFLR